MEIQWQAKMYVGISMISTFPRTPVGTILRQHGTYMENLQCLHGNQFVSVSGRMMRALSPWLTDTSKLLSD